MAKAAKATTTKATTNPKGRPTKLTKELVELARQYLVDTDTMSPVSLLPTFERLSIILGVSRETLYQWEKDNDDFSDILGRLRKSQADKLLQNGLLGRYNSTIAKLMLSKHGYVEKTEQDLRVKEMPKPILGGESQGSGE